MKKVLAVVLALALLFFASVNSVQATPQKPLVDLIGNWSVTIVSSGPDYSPNQNTGYNSIAISTFIATFTIYEQRDNFFLGYSYVGNTAGNFVGGIIIGDTIHLNVSGTMLHGRLIPSSQSFEGYGDIYGNGDGNAKSFSMTKQP